MTLKEEKLEIVTNGKNNTNYNTLFPYPSLDFIVTNGKNNTNYNISGEWTWFQRIVTNGKNNTNYNMQEHIRTC